MRCCHPYSSAFLFDINMVPKDLFVSVVGSDICSLVKDNFFVCFVFSNSEIGIIRYYFPYTKGSTVSILNTAHKNNKNHKKYYSINIEEKHKKDCVA